MRRKDEYFTVVFEGDIRDLENNPMNMKSKFGKVAACGRGNAFDEQEIILDAIARLEHNEPF